MPEQLREIVEQVIDPRQSRVWLACMQGRRLDVVWAIGEVRTDPYEKLTRKGPYFLMGQHVDGDSREKVVSLFETHMGEKSHALQH